MARWAPQATITPEEHHEWATRMWKRMDRDHSQSITRRELDCEEFRSVIRSILAPNLKPGYMGGVVYERAEMNMNQAINFCLRKADLNFDGTLSFEEFKAFTLVLRQDHLAKHNANLIFALFDLDADGKIDEAEFREMYRFFLGHNPTEGDFQAEWARLDAVGKQCATREEYLRWLRASRSPIFRQFRQQHPESAEGAEEGGGHPSRGRPSSASGATRPLWNQRFNLQANINEKAPQSRRAYFTRPQSLPELVRHYETHRGFGPQLEKVRLPPERPPVRVLSTDTATCFSFNPEIAKPGGTMVNLRSKKLEPWEDHWQPPACVKRKLRPGTLDFRCPGQPPSWMFAVNFEDM